jgi:hypothetical protein
MLNGLQNFLMLPPKDDFTLSSTAKSCFQIERCFQIWRKKPLSTFQFEKNPFTSQMELVSRFSKVNTASMLQALVNNHVSFRNFQDLCVCKKLDRMQPNYLTRNSSSYTQGVSLRPTSSINYSCFDHGNTGIKPMLQTQFWPESQEFSIALDWCMENVCVEVKPCSQP